MNLNSLLEVSMDKTTLEVSMDKTTLEVAMDKTTVNEIRDDNKMMVIARVNGLLNGLLTDFLRRAIACICLIGIVVGREDVEKNPQIREIISETKQILNEKIGPSSNEINGWKIEQKLLIKAFNEIKKVRISEKTSKKEFESLFKNILQFLASKYKISLNICRFKYINMTMACALIRIDTVRVLLSVLPEKEDDDPVQNLKVLKKAFEKSKLDKAVKLDMVKIFDLTMKMHKTAQDRDTFEYPLNEVVLKEHHSNIIKELIEEVVAISKGTSGKEAPKGTSGKEAAGGGTENTARHIGQLHACYVLNMDSQPNSQYIRELTKKFNKFQEMPFIQNEDLLLRTFLETKMPESVPLSVDECGKEDLEKIEAALKGILVGMGANPKVLNLQKLMKPSTGKTYEDLCNKSSKGGGGIKHRYAMAGVFCLFTVL